MEKIACEQALLFGRVKQASRERARERRSREGQRKEASAPRSRVLARLASLAQIGELARRLWKKMRIFNTTGETKRERKIVEASHSQTEWCKLYLIVQSAYSRFPQKFAKYPYGRRSVILLWLSLRRTGQSQPSCTYWRGFHRKNDFLGIAYATVVFQVSNFSFIFRCLHSRQRKEPLREYEEKLRTR